MCQIFNKKSLLYFDPLTSIVSALQWMFSVHLYKPTAIFLRYSACRRHVHDAVVALRQLCLNLYIHKCFLLFFFSSLLPSSLFWKPPDRLLPCLSRATSSLQSLISCHVLMSVLFWRFCQNQRLTDANRRSLTSAGANAEAAGKNKPGGRSGLAVAGQVATQYANETQDKRNSHLFWVGCWRSLGI